MERYYLRDPRQLSAIHGKPEGAWLKVPPFPVQWVTRRDKAETFTAEEVEFLRNQNPYLNGCELVPVKTVNSQDIQCATAS